MTYIRMPGGNIVYTPTAPENIANANQLNIVSPSSGGGGSTSSPTPSPSISGNNGPQANDPIVLQYNMKWDPERQTYIKPPPAGQPTIQKGETIEEYTVRSSAHPEEFFMGRKEEAQARVKELNTQAAQMQSNGGYYDESQARRNAIVKTMQNQQQMQSQAPVTSGQNPYLEATQRVAQQQQPQINQNNAYLQGVNRVAEQQRSYPNQGFGRASKTDFQARSSDFSGAGLAFAAEDLRDRNQTTNANTNNRGAIYSNPNANNTTVAENVSTKNLASPNSNSASNFMNNTYAGQSLKSQLEGAKQIGTKLQNLAEYAEQQARSTTNNERTYNVIGRTGWKTTSLLAGSAALALTLPADMMDATKSGIIEWTKENPREAYQRTMKDVKAQGSDVVNQLYADPIPTITGFTLLLAAPKVLGKAGEGAKKVSTSKTSPFETADAASFETVKPSTGGASRATRINPSGEPTAPAGEPINTYKNPVSGAYETPADMLRGAKNSATNTIRGAADAGRNIFKNTIDSGTTAAKNSYNTIRETVINRGRGGGSSSKPTPAPKSADTTATFNDNAATTQSAVSDVYNQPLFKQPTVTEGRISNPTQNAAPKPNVRGTGQRVRNPMQEALDARLGEGQARVRRNINEINNRRNAIRERNANPFRVSIYDNVKPRVRTGGTERPVKGMNDISIYDKTTPEPTNRPPAVRNDNPIKINDNPIQKVNDTPIEEYRRPPPEEVVRRPPVEDEVFGKKGPGIGGLPFGGLGLGGLGSLGMGGGYGRGGRTRNVSINNPMASIRSVVGELAFNNGGRRIKQSNPFNAVNNMRLQMQARRAAANNADLFAQVNNLRLSGYGSKKKKKR